MAFDFTGGTTRTRQQEEVPKMFDFTGGAPKAQEEVPKMFDFTGGANMLTLEEMASRPNTGRLTLEQMAAPRPKEQSTGLTLEQMAAPRPKKQTPAKTISTPRIAGGELVSGGPRRMEAFMSGFTNTPLVKAVTNLFHPKDKIVMPKADPDYVGMIPLGAGEWLPYIAGTITGEAPTIAGAYATGGVAGAGALAGIGAKVPKLANMAKAPLAQLAARGAGAGLVHGTGRAAAEGTPLPESLKNIGIETALFAIGDPAITKGAQVAGKAIGRGVQAYKGSLEAPALKGLDLTRPTPLRSGATLFDDAPPAAATQARISRSEIISKLDNAFAPIRVGRFKIGGKGYSIAGIFKTKPEVIRTRIANDLPTVTHEVGHYLDKKFALANPAFDNELLRIGQRTSLKAYTPEQVRKEGVAEFMRLYLTEPDAAQTMAPKYYAAFDQKLAQMPDVQDVLLTARSDIQLWNNQPAEARILGSLSLGKKESRRMTLDSLYTASVDEIHPIKRYVQQMGVKNLPIKQDPYKLAWLARGWSGRAQTYLHKGVLDVNGNKIGSSLNEALKPVEKELDRFRAYVVAKHSLEAKAAGKETGIMDADAMEVIKNAPAHYQKALGDLVKYQDNIMRELIDSGVMDAGAAAKMRQIYPNYVPFYRSFDETASLDSVAAGLTKSGYANLNNPVKTMKGSTRDIIDPLESIVKNTYLYLNIAERNKVGRAIVELAERTEGMGRLVEKVDAGGRSAKDNVLTVYRNGKPEYYQLDPELYQATLALDKESTNMLVNLLSYPASWLRAGAVLSPDFMIRNPMRDMMTAFINSKYGFIPVWDTFKGLFHAARKSDLYWQWMNNGGGMATLVSLDRDYLQKSMRDILAKSTKDKLKTVAHPRVIMDMLRAFSELSEQATRLGEFSRGIKQGANPLEVAIQSRDVTLDFGRIGTKTKSANRTIAFFNAVVQGSDKMRRQFKQHPVQSTLKATMGITLPSIILYMNNRNDPRYQELPQWQKDLFWIVPTENYLIRIPKPFELGILFGTVPERIMDYILTQDPKAFDGIGKAMFDAGTPSFIPTALMPLLEVGANYSFFTQRPIVSQREDKLEPSLQHSPYTTEAAKLLAKGGEHLPLVGDKLGSPRNVEHLMRGYTGGLGMYGAKALDPAIKKVKGGEQIPKPASSPLDWPGVKGVTAKPYQSPQSVEDLYRELDKLETQYASLKQTGKLKPNSMDYASLKRYRKADQRLSEMRKRVRQIQNNPAITPERKRAVLDRLNMRMMNVARVAQKKPVIKH